MNPPERVRWCLAFAGLVFLETASFMPMFGGTAKHLYRCRGREFTGEFDDCFTDYLPILELTLPLFTLLLLYPFAKLAFSLFAPDPERRRLRWRLASDTSVENLYPTLHAIAGVGAVWAFWRAATYPLAAEMWPYWLFWLAFGAWFLLGIAAAWPSRQEA